MTVAKMLGSRVNTVLPWSQCNCGCTKGSEGRRDERRIQKRRERQAWTNEIRFNKEGVL